MVTITLHDKDAISVLALVQTYRKRQGENTDPSLVRAESAFKCALLICDCSTAPSNVGRTEEDAQAGVPLGDSVHGE